MEIAKDNLKIVYEGNLEGLPFDLDALSNDVKLALFDLQTSLTSYVRAVIKNMPTGNKLNIKIDISANAGEIVAAKINNDFEFLLLDENGKHYLLQHDKELDNENMDIQR